MWVYQLSFWLPAPEVKSSTARYLLELTVLPGLRVIMPTRNALVMLMKARPMVVLVIVLRVR